MPKTNTQQNQTKETDMQAKKESELSINERAKTLARGYKEKSLSTDFSKSIEISPQTKVNRSQSLKKLEVADQKDEIDFAFAEPSEGLYTEIKARKLILRRYHHFDQLFVIFSGSVIGAVVVCNDV